MINLSIIIPHFESVESLKKLISSIPNYDDIEVIVIDDKTVVQKEELWSLVRNNNRANLTYFFNESEFKGAGTCRNIGISKSSGKWILFADADDYFTEGFYQQLSEYFDSEFDVVYFLPTSIDLENMAISNRHIEIEKLINDWLKEKNRQNLLKLRYKFVSPISKLIKSSLIKNNKVLFDNTLYANDMMFSAKIGYLHGDFAVSEKIIYCITKGNSTLTSKTSKESFNQRLNVYIDYHNYLRSKLSKEDFLKLELFGSRYIIMSYTNKLGAKAIIKTTTELLANKVRIFKIEYLNPFLVIKRIVGYRKSYLDKVERSKK